MIKSNRSIHSWRQDKKAFLFYFNIRINAASISQPLSSPSASLSLLGFIDHSFKEEHQTDSKNDTIMDLSDAILQSNECKQPKM